MVKRKRSEFVAGVFVLAGLGAVFASLAWLGVVRPFTPRGQEVVFAVEQAQGYLGVEAGSPIRINYKTVGKIDDVRFDPENKRTLYAGRISLKDVAVHSDAEAVAVVEFIGGMAVVLVTCGTEAAPLADAAHPVPLSIGPSALLRQIGYEAEQRAQLQSALKDAAATASRIQALIDRETSTQPGSLLSKIRSAADNIEAGAAKFNTVAARLEAETVKSDRDSLLGKLDAAAVNAREITGEMKQTWAEVRSTWQKLRPQIEATASAVAGYVEKDFAEIIAAVRDIRKKVDGILSDWQKVSSEARDFAELNRPRLEEMLAYLKATAANLLVTSKEVRRNPWWLLRPPPGGEDYRTQALYSAIREFATLAGELDDALTRLEALAKARGEGLRSADPELLKVRQRIQAALKDFDGYEDRLRSALEKK